MAMVASTMRAPLPATLSSKGNIRGASLSRKVPSSRAQGRGSTGRCPSGVVAVSGARAHRAHAEDAKEAEAKLTCDRRAVLSTVAGSCLLSLHASSALAEEAVGGFVVRAKVGPGADEPKVEAPKDPLKAFVTRNYQFKYDPAIFEVQALEETYEPSSTIGSSPQLLYNNKAAPKNPLEARLTSKDGCERRLLLNKSLANRLVAAFRSQYRELVTDISELGPPEEVANLVIPPGSIVSAYNSFERISPGRIGKDGKQKPGIPHQYYTYKFSRGDLGGFMVASANKGKVFVFLAAGEKELAEKPENSKILRALVDSFIVRQ